MNVIDFGGLMLREQLVEISCDEIEELYGEYREGELPSYKTEVIKQHIAQCEECQTFVDTYELVIAVAKTLQAPQRLPDGFRERLRKGLNERLGISLSESR
jgi:predicted anti-sigma-YlaC factor YlaD